MATKGFDCATPLTAQTAAAFAADGFEFVARYLVPSGWKRLTVDEAELITAAGLQIVSVYETTADRALGGREAGLADGAAAIQVAKLIGQPEGSCIYFAVDFDATAVQMQAVIAYIEGAKEAADGYITGAYGSYSVVEALHASGACSRFWQTYAWSSGKKSAAANIYQYENDITMNGIGVDLNESYGNEGGWNLAVDGEEEDDMALNLQYDWQWKQLGDALDGLYHKGLISDYTWAEKAYNRELTSSQLSWLNTIIIARQAGVQV
ncbi:DUF1906 domain-containing protein [Paenibacillus sp. y28]|uniref:DUF1906 domain-containing protein n=1 Tax=Paenibacillus sp. y28 TaxID=3129110 RepID=UPI0030179063